MEVNVWSVTEGQKDVWSVHPHCSEVEAAKGSMQKVSPGSTGHLGTNSGQQHLLLLRRISASVASWLRDGSSCDTSGRSGCCFCCWRRSEGLKVFCPPPRCHSCLRSSVNFCTMQMERNHLKMKRRHDSFLLHELQEPPPLCDTEATPHWELTIGLVWVVWSVLWSPLTDVLTVPDTMKRFCDKATPVTHFPSAWIISQDSFCFFLCGDSDTADRCCHLLSVSPNCSQNKITQLQQYQNCKIITSQ